LGLVQPRRLQPPRYGLHGLVRSLAVELSGTTDNTELERRYLETVLRLLTIADEQIDHATTNIELDRGAGPDLPAADAAASAGATWLDVEAAVVRAAVGLALANWPRLAGTIAVRFNGFLAVRDDREVRHEVVRTARDAAARADEVELEAELLQQRAADVLSRHPDASGEAANAIDDDPGNGHAVRELERQQKLLGLGVRHS